MKKLHDERNSKIHEKDRTAIRLIASVTTIPPHSATFTHSTVKTPSSSIPTLANMFKSGRATKIKGKMFIQTLYILSKSKVLRNHGMKNNCKIADVIPDTASEYPIMSAGRDKPPEVIGEKQKRTKTTSNDEARKERPEPERHKARTRGLDMRCRMLADEGGGFRVGL